MRKSQRTSNRINNTKIIPKHVRFKLQNEKAKTKRKFCKKPARKNSQFSSLQSLIHVRLLAAPWTAAHQASLSISNSCSLLKLMYVESVMPSNQLILCHPLLVPPSIFLSIRVFSNESALWSGGQSTGASASTGFPGGSTGKEPSCSVGDLGLTPGLGRSPGEGSGYPLQYSCLYIYISASSLPSAWMEKKCWWLKDWQTNYKRMVQLL